MTFCFKYVGVKNLRQTVRDLHTCETNGLQDMAFFRYARPTKRVQHNFAKFCLFGRSLLRNASKSLEERPPRVRSVGGHI